MKPHRKIHSFHRTREVMLGPALVKTWLQGWPSDVILSKAEVAADKFELLVRDFDLAKGP